MGVPKFEVYSQVILVPDYLWQQVEVITKSSTVPLRQQIEKLHLLGVEFGFVFSVIPSKTGYSQEYFCRFWSWPDLRALRTLANSERCNEEDLAQFESVKYVQVVDAYLDIEDGLRGGA